MFKDLAIMKALRYLLIVMSLVSVLSVNAQGTAQLPQAQMKSTSVMNGSGSTLPQAAVTGAYVTGSTPEAYAPTGAHGGQIRRDVGGGSTANDEDPDAPEEPFPIGDAALPLALLACAYVLFRYVRTRKRA